MTLFIIICILSVVSSFCLSFLIKKEVVVLSILKNPSCLRRYIPRHPVEKELGELTFQSMLLQNHIADAERQVAYIQSRAARRKRIP